jgi:hypothetical protein
MKIVNLPGPSLWIAILLACGGAARAGEFQVNQFTTSGQNKTRISHDSTGGFVIAWYSYTQDGSGDGVFGRRFDSSGSALGPEFQVNQVTTGDQRNPAISHDSSGGFVAVWNSFGQDGSSDGVFGRRFDSSGSALGAEFQLNEYTTSSQEYPTITHDSSGGFVVAWHSHTQDGSSNGIFGRRFDSSGGALGAEFQANQYTTDQQSQPTISHDWSGGFLVAWYSYQQDGPGSGVFGRRFDSSGTALGAEFQVNQYTTSYQTDPSISHDWSGGFVVAWESLGQDGSDSGIFARRFDSSGSALEAEFQINQHTISYQGEPTISHDQSGGFVVVWDTYGQDGAGDGVFGRRFDSSGGALGAEFQLNQYTTNNQTYPAISHDSSGGFAVAWASQGQDGSAYGVFARRVPRPTVAVDDDMVMEGQTGSSNATFLVQLSEPPELEALDLDYATADGTASAGSDYTSTSGMLSIPAGQSSGEVTVPVLGDTLYEADEDFGVNVTTTGFANLLDPAAVGLIVNDDAPPSLAIGDVQITEGNAGMSEAQFAVSISEASGLPAQVDFSTLDGTALAGEDYTAASGQLIFPAMSTASQTAVVLIHGDLDLEPDETFSVQLTDPVDATLADGLAVGTILNDDDGNFLITTGPAGGGASQVRRYQGD